MSSMLDHVVAVERYREILETLTPGQFAVAALLVDGGVATYEDVAVLLGLTRAAVGLRMDAARVKLLNRFPELRAEVAGCSACRHPKVTGQDC